MTETILSNARLILKNEIFFGAIVIKDGFIRDISSGSFQSSTSIDCDGSLIAPGLIELHTDNLERHLQPRPGVSWPAEAAVLSHDAELASAGITTVFDAIRVGSILSDKSNRYKKYARKVVDIISKMQEREILRINHFIHLRAEICSETLSEELDEFNQSDNVQILSLMDHTPGQRQFKNLQKFKEYLGGKHGMNKSQVEVHLKKLRNIHATYGRQHEKDILVASSRLGTVLVSHDDTTKSDVANSIKIGIEIAEFPTTLQAVKVLNFNGIPILMGAPNFLRNQSHSGNISANEVEKLGALDILSSDYMPSSLLYAAVELGQQSENLSYGFSKVTSKPAEVIGLKDRGSIEIGKKADLILFDIYENFPVIKRVIVGGK